MGRPQVHGKERIEVSEVELRRRMLDAYGIHVEPEMTRYILRKLEQAAGALRELPVIGGEARTGTPRRVVVDPMILLQSSPESPAPPKSPSPQSLSPS